MNPSKIARGVFTSAEDSTPQHYSLAQSYQSSETKAFVQTIGLFVDFPCSISIADILVLRHHLDIDDLVYRLSTNVSHPQVPTVGIIQNESKRLKRILPGYIKSLSKGVNIYTSASLDTFFNCRYGTPPNEAKRLLVRQSKTSIQHHFAETLSACSLQGQNDNELDAMEPRVILMDMIDEADPIPVPASCVVGAYVRVVAATGKKYQESGKYHPCLSNGFAKVQVIEVGETSTTVKVATGVDRSSRLEVPNELIVEISQCGLGEIESRSDDRLKRKECNTESNQVNSERSAAKKVFTQTEQNLSKSQSTVENLQGKLVKLESLLAKTRVVAKKKEETMKSKELSWKRAYQAKVDSETVKKLRKGEERCGTRLSQVYISHHVELTKLRETTEEYQKQSLRDKRALQSISRGDSRDPSLTIEGRILATKVAEERNSRIVNAEINAFDAIGDAKRLRGERDHAIKKGEVQHQKLLDSRAAYRSLTKKFDRATRQLEGLKDGSTYRKYPEKLPMYLSELRAHQVTEEDKFVRQLDEKDEEIAAKDQRLHSLEQRLELSRFELKDQGEEAVKQFNLLVSESAKSALYTHAEKSSTAGLGASCSLIGCVSLTGRLYSQDMIELGLKLMSLELSGQQAQSVLRTFVEFQYPDLKEGINYRIPNVRRFNEWRNYLGPLAHYVALSVVKVASRTHLATDATTKNGYHVLQTSMTCEIKDQLTGEVTVLNVPVKFSLTSSGKAKYEAKKVKEDALRSTLLEGLTVTLLTIESSITDNAARSTSREVEKLKREELEEIIDSSEEEINAFVNDNPKEVIDIIEAYRQLSPVQREDVKLVHELGCNGHSLNLLLECCSKDETSVMKENMINHRAANVIQRYFCVIYEKNKCLHRYIFKGYDKKQLKNVSTVNTVEGFILSMAKMFPSTVDKSSDARLQSKNELDAFAKQTNTKYRKLPGKVGSRQSYNVEVAEVIVANTEFYSDYFHKHRNDSNPNNLAYVCNVGINDIYIQAALRARCFIASAFNETARWFLHANGVSQPMIYTINKCIESFIQDMEFYSASQLPPSAEQLGEDVLSAIEEKFSEQYQMILKRYTTWWDNKKDVVLCDYANAINSKYWAMVVPHLKSAAPFMLKTLIRNMDPDHLNTKTLEKAPTTSDHVESCFSHLDRSVTKIFGANVQANTGLAQGSAMGLMNGKGDMRNAAEKEVNSEQRKGVSNVEDREERIAHKMKSKELMNFFSLPRELRWKLIKDVQKKYKSLCVEQPRLEREEHDAAKLERQDLKAEQEKRRTYLKAINYEKYKNIPLAINKSMLKSLYTGDPGKHILAMRDQLRVMEHVYLVKKSQLPNLGGDIMSAGDPTGEVERLRLSTGLEKLVESMTFSATPPGCPTPYSIRTQHPAASELASRLDKEHLKKVSTIWKEFNALTSQGIFTMPRSLQRVAERNQMDEDSDGTIRSRTARDATLGIAPGAEFEEDGVSWKVLDFEFSEEYSNNMIWYYDVDMADELNISEEDMVLSITSENPGDLEPLERSKVSEVKKWIIDYKKSCDEYRP